MSLLQVISRFKQSFIEQRRSIRERVNFPAWIDVGDRSQRIECTVLDVSEGGARLMVPESAKLPREFWLVFSKSGTRRRRCQKVWRSDEQIGVTYIGPLHAGWLPSLLN